MKTIYSPKDLSALSRRVARRKRVESIKNHGELIFATSIFVAYFVFICIFD